MNAILLRNGLVIDINLGTFNKRDIFIQDGKIKNIAVNLDDTFENCEIVDIKECFVVPGFIDCHTHLGIIEEATGKLGIDNNEESNPVTPQLRGIDGINPLDIAFHDAVHSGVTCAMVGPGSNNVVGGQNVVIKTYGNVIDHMVVKNPSGFKIALGENPLSTYGKNKKAPVTRMGIAALIRELFMKAQDYMDKKEKGKLEERNIQLESVIPLLKGDILLRAHAHRADDIITAIRIADEFNIRNLVIEHGTEAHLIKDVLKEKNIPVAFGPMLTPRIKMELKARSYGSIHQLIEAGVKTAIITDHPYNSIDQLRSLASLAMAEGLPFLDAMKAITTTPAEILQCGKFLGKIDIDYDADMVVLDGNPLDIMSKVLMTIINGKVVCKR